MVKYQRLQTQYANKGYASQAIAGEVKTRLLAMCCYGYTYMDEDLEDAPPKPS